VNDPRIRVLAFGSFERFASLVWAPDEQIFLVFVGDALESFRKLRIVQRCVVANQCRCGPHLFGLPLSSRDMRAALTSVHRPPSFRTRSRMLGKRSCQAETPRDASKPRNLYSVFW